MLYTPVKNIAGLLLKSFLTIKYTGTENIPKSGGFVLSPNHISNFDPPTVGVGIKRKVNFMAKKELFQNKILGGFLRSILAYPVDRNRIEKDTIKHTLQLLRNGEVVGIFPEGTRSETSELGKFHTGAAMFAKKANVPIVPVSISGEYKLFKQVNVHYGTPVDISDFESLEEATEYVRAKLMHYI